MSTSCLYLSLPLDCARFQIIEKTEGTLEWATHVSFPSTFSPAIAQTCCGVAYDPTQVEFTGIGSQLSDTNFANHKKRTCSPALICRSSSPKTALFPGAFKNCLRRTIVEL
eukprot:746447-Karenia_brevis.AAC.1